MSLIYDCCCYVKSSFLDQLYVRQELWKFRRVFDNYEKEWMNVAFKKLDINIISSKVAKLLLLC